MTLLQPANSLLYGKKGPLNADIASIMSDCEGYKKWINNRKILNYSLNQRLLRYLSRCRQIRSSIYHNPL